MSIFPVINSTLCPKYVAFFIKEKYDLAENVVCKILKIGVNHTYLVECGKNKYVFRVYSYNWRAKKEIKEELQLLNLLKENNISVSYPLIDISGKFIQRIEAPEGERYGVLFSYAKGTKIRNLTEKNCVKIGELMGKIHEVLNKRSIKRDSYDIEILTKLPYQYAKEHFLESMDEMKFVKKAGDYISSEFGAVNSENIRFGIVHLDIWYDNMNIEDDSAITIFDFDFCGNGWLFLDVAYFSVQLFNTEPDKDKFEVNLHSFYKGYKQYSVISEDEKKLIPVAALAVWIFYLGVQSRRFNTWSNIFLTNNYLKHYVGVIKLWLLYNDIDIMGKKK
ncbi:phosphotransferase [Aquimarina sp. I32.4]|uniref:phosphotransferase n=1 Tax=Aquimarina sp. I32.4 TaxID=2053903 RepID=UPI000CDF1851|nr:phosphotransferase [Aquimarina sp. I32.4]